jgi:hypothetical protein
MDQLKPIEPGCLAVVINSKFGHSGKVLTVGNRVPTGTVIHSDCVTKRRIRLGGNMKWWETSLILEKKATDGLSYKSCHVPEHNLMRIDGDWTGKETEVEETLKEQ